MIALSQALHDTLHVTRVDQRPLGEPLVVDDAELLEIGSNVGNLNVSCEREDSFVALLPEQGSGTRDQRIDVGFLVAAGRLVGGYAAHQGLDIDDEIPTDVALECGRNLMNVRTAIAVRRKLDRRPAPLQISQPHTQREDVHLAACVVDVVLALHVESGRFEDVRDTCAVRRAPAVPDVERAGGVGGDELHLNAPAVSERRVRALRAGDEDAAHYRGERLRRDAEVDEARPGDRNRRDRGRFRQPCQDALGDLTRLALCDAGKGEGYRTGEIAMAAPAAALDRDLRQRIERKLSFVAKCRQRVLEERSDVLLHWSDTPRFAGKMVVAPVRRPEYGGGLNPPSMQRESNAFYMSR